MGLVKTDLQEMTKTTLKEIIFYYYHRQSEHTWFFVVITQNSDTMFFLNYTFLGDLTQFVCQHNFLGPNIWLDKKYFWTWHFCWVKSFFDPRFGPYSLFKQDNGVLFIIYLFSLKVLFMKQRGGTHPLVMSINMYFISFFLDPINILSVFKYLWGAKCSG